MADNVSAIGKRRYSTPRASVAGTFAEAVGISRQHAEQLLSNHGTNSVWARLHAYVDACHRTGRLDLLWKKLTPLLERVNNRPAPAYGPQLLREVAAAEAAETQVRQDMLLDEGRDRAREIRALAQLRVRVDALLESLRAEQACQ